MPSAEELARPLIDGLMTLHHVFSDRARAMEWDLDNGDAYEAEARELVATVEQVASMLRSAITGCLAHEFRE